MARQVMEDALSFFYLSEPNLMHEEKQFREDGDREKPGADNGRDKRSWSSMVQPNVSAEIYQLHILLLQINPPLWRRLHVPSDSSIAMLHDLLQIAFDWSDFHLHRFVIRGKE
jgi:hypothetical protein